MNIIQLVSSARTSGAEKHVVVLSERLRQRGHQVIAICPQGEWLPSQLRGAGVPTHELPMHGANSLRAALQLKRFVHEHQIDLIHAHLTRATYLGWLTGLGARLPVVSSVHCRTHDIAYRYLFPNQRNRIITVSDFIRDALLRQGVPSSRVRTIYNGTEFGEELRREIQGSNGSLATEASGASVEPAFSSVCAQMKSEALPVRAELSLPPEAEIVGLFARVEEFKGHYVLARALRAIVAARPRAYFLCVGPVEAQTQRELWEIASADGLAERLRFTGVRNDVERLMRETDVVILPSRYEACSMVIIEAMALGKPVIATRAGGNPELVRHGETGLLIERTPEALAQSLLTVLTDTKLRRCMGEAARHRAGQHFTAQVMVDNIEALYREMLPAAAC